MQLRKKKVNGVEAAWLHYSFPGHQTSAKHTRFSQVFT